MASTVATSLAALKGLRKSTSFDSLSSPGSHVSTDGTVNPTIQGRKLQGHDRLRLLTLQFPQQPVSHKSTLRSWPTSTSLPGCPPPQRGSADLLPSIEKLLNEYEERMATRLQQEIASAFERHVDSFRPAASISSNRSIKLPPDAPISPAGVASYPSERFFPRPSNGVSPEGEITKGIAPNVESNNDLERSEISEKSGKEEKESKEVLWWRQEKEWVVTRGAAMLSSFVESKGWLKKTPLSRAAALELYQQKTCLKRFIVGSNFDTFCGVTILANSILLGYQVEYMALNNTLDGPTWSTTAQAIFNFWFFLEVMLRVWALGAEFIFSKFWKWNVFDLVIVTISIIEYALQVGKVAESGTFAVVRALRILRLVRAVRIIRVVRFFSQLRLMVNSTMNSFRPFFWALCLLLLLIYIVGVQVTQSVLEYTHSQDHEEQLMLDYFGTLHGSIYTLFQMISGGVSWRDPVEVLLRVHWSYAPIMLMYVSFTVFAVLNIVTGVFVGTAMHSAQQDQDVVIQDAMNEEDSFANEVLRIFDEADSNRTGFVTCEELEVHLQDPRVRAYLHHLALDVAEARGLFNLLDICNTGRVSSHEFLLGCMRLKGPAKNVDVATILYENKRMMDTWSFFMNYVEEQFEYVLHVLGGPVLEDTLASIPEGHSADQPQQQLSPELSVSNGFWKTQL